MYRERKSEREREEKSRRTRISIVINKRRPLFEDFNNIDISVSCMLYLCVDVVAFENSCYLVVVVVIVFFCRLFKFLTRFKYTESKEFAIHVTVWGE